MVHDIRITSFALLAFAILFNWAARANTAMPRYTHIIVIIAENKGYSQIIGNTEDAPRPNALASKYGLATNFYREVHPSEANYIAMLGGDTFGIHDDDARYCQPGQSSRFCGNALAPGYVSHSIGARSIMDQLQEADRRFAPWQKFRQS